MIESYLTQMVSLKRRKDGGFRRGSDDYHPEETIKSRWIPKVQQVSNEAGQLIASDTTVQTVVKVAPGDLLSDPEDGTEWPVMAVASYPMLGGETQFYEAYL